MNPPQRNRYTTANQLIHPHLPHISKSLGGEFILMEGEGRVRRLLDMRGGIDGYLVTPHHIKGVAVRVRNIKKRPFNNFTIRSHSYQTKNTELYKIPKLIRDNAIYPNLTLSIQLWEDGSWLSGCCVYTKHLFRFIEDNRELVMSRERRLKDGCGFVEVFWDELKRECFKIKIF